MVADGMRLCEARRLQGHPAGIAHKSVIIIVTMELGPLSDRQRFVIWGTLCLAVLPILYPMPAHYAWDGDGWNRTSYHARADQRNFLWDYDFFGNTRPDMRRMATEAVLVFVMGMGLAFC